MKRTTIGCIFVGVLIFLGILITFVQMSRSQNRTQPADEKCTHVANMQHVISLSDNGINHTFMAERFPYVAAVTRNSTSLWTFACFASVILFKWIITSAHCRVPGHTHRVILFYDFNRNQTHAFPILYWRVHEKYNSSVPNPKYDIAVAKLNIAYYNYVVRPAVFDESEATDVEASVWKTVSTMDKKLYLTNHFEKYEVRIGNPGKCYESYGVEIDDSLICIDTTDYDDCFIHEFGPIFAADKVVGVIAIKPADCEMKFSIFTNISYYTNWILRTTYDG